VKEEKNVRVNIDHGDAGFYSDSISIIYNPSKFVIDFKQTSPRIDTIQGKSHESLVVKHKVILLDTQFAKVFLETLKNAVSNYEKKFGPIKMPPKAKTQKTAPTTLTSSEGSYIG
jgi:hypothetical protein